MVHVEDVKTLMFWKKMSSCMTSNCKILQLTSILQDSVYFFINDEISALVTVFLMFPIQIVVLSTDTQSGLEFLSFFRE